MPLEESQEATGGRAILLSHTQRVEHTEASLSPTHQHWQLTNRERTQRAGHLNDDKAGVAREQDVPARGTL